MPRSHSSRTRSSQRRCRRRIRRRMHSQAQPISSARSPSRSSRCRRCRHVRSPPRTPTPRRKVKIQRNRSRIAGRLPEVYLGSMPDGPVEAVPGVVVVWSGAAPSVQVYRIPASGLVIGRELLGNTTDDRISRQHARVVWRDRRFVVTDLGSRNGTYAGGHALVDREVTVTPPSVVRTGRTVSVLLEDIRRFEGGTISSE